MSAHKMPRATPQMSACSSSVQRVAKPTWRWECFRRSLAACTERRKLMREADRQSGETSCKTDVIITIATSHHRHRSSPSLSPPPSPSEITGPIGREEGGINVNVMVVVIVVMDCDLGFLSCDLGPSSSYDLGLSRCDLGLSSCDLGGPFEL